jgi:hypothetical protein
MESVIGVFTIIGGLVGSFITYIIFKLERKDKFRMVAIEKRLTAHQEAFKLWDKLLHVIHFDDEAKIKTVNEAREFWYNNSLFLEKGTREKFSESIYIVDFYHQKLEMYKSETNPKIKLKLKNEFMSDWNNFMKLPEYIQKEVELEPIKPIVKENPEGE